ncbi:MAG TPA: hypothetical protein VMD05_09835 [Candidatus Nanoarchaeia archaeon]|nr:hypothetical protein [Candidatus Nanoarchaeia archaeon]
MGYQPRIKRRSASRKYGKGERGKSKKKEQKRGCAGSSSEEVNHVATAKEVIDGTLQRLHILGNQRFGFYPFSEHFERWLLTLENVLYEFESNPNISVDEIFVNERSQIISTVQTQLEEKRYKETTLELELRCIADSKTQLERIKKDYLTRAREIKQQKNTEIKRLYSIVGRLKKGLNEVLHMRTGFFRGVSRKDREQRELAAVQALSDAQRTLELAILDFKESTKRLRDEFESKRDPYLHRLKDAQKRTENMETDGSLEDRWFACEALADAVNALLQRKAIQLH